MKWNHRSQIDNDNWNCSFRKLEEHNIDPEKIKIMTYLYFYNWGKVIKTDQDIVSKFSNELTFKLRLTPLEHKYTVKVRIIFENSGGDYIKIYKTRFDSYLQCLQKELLLENRIIGRDEVEM